MARHYSTMSCFRQMPNALLARYFHARGLFADLDFTTMKEGKPDTLFAAWQSLPDRERNAMDAELREIFAMSCEKGVIAILDEARQRFGVNSDEFAAFNEHLSALPGHCERAMVTFLDHQPLWKVATLFYHADTLPYWRKRRNLPHHPAAVDDASTGHLADLIRDYFHHTEGRGRHCVVEPYRRRDLDYFFAFPEDHAQRSIEWVDGRFDPRPHNPAFEIVYVYSREAGTLDLNYRGGRQAIGPLQRMFAQAILQIDTLPADPKDERVYDLDPLRARGFQFVRDVGSGIERVAVKTLRLSSRLRKGDRVTLEADVARDPEAVYDLLDTVGRSIPLHLYHVTQVELAVSVAMHADQPAKTVPIRIGYPNSCSLKYDDLGQRLRAMLDASGIELKALTDTPEPAEA